MKTKKTYKAEAQLYFDLWQEAEADGKASDTVVERLTNDLRMLQRPRTLVLTPTHHRAMYVLNKLAIPPRGRDTLLISDWRMLEGLHLEDGDRVIMIDGWSDTRGLGEVWNHIVARRRGGLLGIWVSRA